MRALPANDKQPLSHDGEGYADHQSTRGGDKATPAPTSDRCPAWWRQVFASLFTPTWGLCVLIVGCMFLPSYEGCSGQTIYPVQILVEPKDSSGDVYLAFLITWPYWFALVTLFGTVWLASGSPRRAAWLWWGLVLLVLVHTALVTLALIEENWQLESGYDLLKRLQQQWGFLLASIGLLIAVPLSLWRSRGWFEAAVRLQLGLALLAAVAFSSIIPAFVLARQLYIGGKLAITFSVLLVVSTIVQQLDGRRALTRQRGESPLQLSLRAMLVLMLVGGIACSWIGVATIVDPASPGTTQPPAVGTAPTQPASATGGPAVN